MKTKRRNRKIHRNRKIRVQYDNGGHATVSVITKDGQSRVVAENIACPISEQPRPRARGNVVMKKEFQQSYLDELFGIFKIILIVLFWVFLIGFLIIDGIMDSTES